MKHVAKRDVLLIATYFCLRRPLDFSDLNQGDYLCNYNWLEYCRPVYGQVKRQFPHNLGLHCF